MSFEPGASWQPEDNGEKHASESAASGTDAEEVVELDSEPYAPEDDQLDSLNDQFPEAAHALNALQSEYNTYDLNYSPLKETSNVLGENNSNEHDVDEQGIQYESDDQGNLSEYSGSGHDESGRDESEQDESDHDESDEQNESDDNDISEGGSDDLNGITASTHHEISDESDLGSVVSDNRKDNQVRSATNNLVARRSQSPELRPLSNHNQTTIDQLDKRISELETEQFDLQRQLHRSHLECESAKAAHKRLEIRAEQDSDQLKLLRKNSTRERAQLEAAVVEYKSSLETLRIELSSKERGFNTLKNRFEQQSATLAKLREQVDELQRIKAENQLAIDRFKADESRSSKQLAFLSKELGDALDTTAQSRAELDLQRQTMSRIRAEAREEVLAELAGEQLNGSLGHFGGGEDESIWRKQYVALRRQMDAFVEEIELREPEITLLQTAHEEAEVKLSEAQEQLAKFETERRELESKVRHSERRFNDLALHQSLTEQVSNDLRRQLLVLLTEKALAKTGFEPMSPEDEDELMRLRDQVARSDRELKEELAVKGDSAINGEQLINERLLMFRDIAELQSQNEALVVACKELASQIDPHGDGLAQFKARAYKTSAEEIEAATGALESLQNKLMTVKLELSDSKNKEKSSFQTIEEQKSTIDDLKSRVEQLQHELKETSQRFAENSVNLNDTSVVASKLEEELLRSQLINAEQRSKDFKLEFDQAHEEHIQVLKQLTHAQHSLGRAEQRLILSEQQSQELKAQIANAQHDISNLRKENQELQVREQNLVSEIAQLRAEADQHHQPQLQSKLMDQMNKIEALVASQKLHTPTDFSNSNSSAKLTELQNELSLRDKKIQEKELQIAKLEDMVKQASSIPNSQGEEQSQNVELLKSEIASLETAKDDISNQLSALQEHLSLEKSRAQARDDELVEQVNNLEDQVTEAQLKADELAYQNAKLSEDLNKQSESFDSQTANFNGRIEELTKLSEELTRNLEEANKREEEASKNAEELRRTIDLSQDVGEDNAANNTSVSEPSESQDVERQLRTELEETKAKLELAYSQYPPETPLNNSVVSAPLDVNGVDDLDGLKQLIGERINSEALSKFESIVIETEQTRTKEIIKRKLEEVRAEAYKQGEDSATRRSTMKSKLRDQNMNSLKAKNKELENQVEELRIKVRRLKGGDQNDDNPDPQNSAQKPVSAPPVFPAFPFHSSAFEPSKRFGVFEENEAKKRKEE